MGKRNENSDLKKIKLETGTVYQTEKGGNYYFRYQIRGDRKCVSLKTRNLDEAVRKAKELVPIVQATSVEVISSHVKVARNLVKKHRELALDKVWETYSKHPDKATPATMHEELSYESTFNEFRTFIGPKIKQFANVTTEHAAAFSDYLKNSGISVSTHNRKIIRLRKIFETLKDYREENPFAAPSLRRKNREEQDIATRRIAFTREEEEQIRQVLDDPQYKLKNKAEIKVVFYIGMYTGQRLKDCVLMQWQNVDLEQRRIFVKQFKTGKEVSIPLAEPLRQLLSEVKAQNLSSTYISPNVAMRYKQKDARGKSVGDNYVNIDVMRVIRWTGVETTVDVPGRKRKMTIRGFHSLRHSFCSHCAEAGVPKAVVVSIIGSDSSILDRFYTHIGEEAQLAAIEAISGTGSTTPTIKIKRVLEYIASIQNPSQELLEIEKILKA